MKTKKTYLIVVFALMNILSYSQKQEIDTIRLQNLDLQSKTFCDNLDKFVQKIKNTENIEAINQASLKMNKETVILIDSINTVFKLNDSDDGLTESLMYNYLAGTYSDSNTNLAGIYSSMGYITMFSGKTGQNKYNNIKEVRNITARMSRNKKIERLKKLLNKVSKLNNKFKN